MIDLGSILAFVLGLDPATAAIGAGILFVIQRLSGGKGLGLSELLASILKPKAAPVGPSAPVVPSTPAPADPALVDPLANRPVLRNLRDILGGLVHTILTGAPSDKAAVAEFTRIVSVLHPDDPLLGGKVSK